jgi:hypothetical protein
MGWNYLKRRREKLEHTQCLSTNLPAFGANFVPSTAMHFNGSIAELPRQGNDFGYDQFCNTARVCKWRVEDGNSTSSSEVEINLVGSDTEASDDDQILGFAQNSLAQLGL